MKKLILVTLSFLIIGISSASDTYNPYGHFWFSFKQYKIIHRNFDRMDTYCIIKGKTKIYTQWTLTKENSANFDDMTYLGFGYTIGIFKKETKLLFGTF